MYGRVKVESTRGEEIGLIDEKRSRAVRSFVAEGDQRVDAGGAAGRKEASGEAR